MDIKHYKEIYRIIEKYDHAGIAYVSEDKYKSEAIDIANRGRTATIGGVAADCKSVPTG